MSQIVSVSPHCHGKITTQSIMRDVLIAPPALVAGVINFGWRALLVTAVCAAACMFFEWGFEKLCGKPKHHFRPFGGGQRCAAGVQSAGVHPAVAGRVRRAGRDGGRQGGCSAASAKTLQIPRIVARIVLFLAFSSSMTAWVYPDAVSSATPLAMLAKGEHVDLSDAPARPPRRLHRRDVRACIAARLCVSAHSPRRHVADAGLLRRDGLPAEPDPGQDALAQVLSGGLLLGAIFMATDYSTSPARPGARCCSASARDCSRCSSASMARTPRRVVRNPVHEHPDAVSDPMDADANRSEVCRHEKQRRL